ncbi:MAG: hypothetical protein KatS3mg105_3605 [Gemmatales bacterium]|nr:MAG: hypothetical protein KatS3mg105_3605 [Gemmatales bacterium]
MTTLGKILVVVNFLFALITGAFIIMVFTVGTNWKDSYDKLHEYYKVSQANVKTYAEELADIKNTTEKELAKRDQELARLREENDTLKKDKDQLKGELAEARKQAKLSSIAAMSATEELARSRQEVKVLTEAIAERNKSLLALEKKNKELLDQATQDQIARQTVQEQAKSLAERLDNLQREYQRLQSGGTAGGILAKRDIVKPPPEDVEGIVKAIDAKSGLITISIGSDAGLSRGNTLEVYRLRPEPKYLGKIRILDVTPHNAVGRLLQENRLRSIREGDTVASSILRRP